MANLKDSTTEIIKELTRLQTVPATHRDKDDQFPLPRMIGAGNDRSILVSKKIDDIIIVVADQLVVQDASLSTKVTSAEWRSMVRVAFGPALATIDLDAPAEANATTVLRDVQLALTKRIAQHGVREFSFGCTLFGNSTIESFLIGPARFEPRLDWLTRKKNDGAISETVHRRVEQIWSGKKLRKRQASMDSIREQDILDTILGCPFVCSVTASEFGPEAGREKALTAARLALAAIALLWSTPSRALEGMNLLFDRRVHQQKALTFVQGKTILAGSRLSHMPHGPWLEDGEWETLFAEQSSYFGVVGDVLSYLIDATAGGNRPAMLNAFAQALLWFHEGCRESVTLMGIVKFSATLDALSCGGKSGGIKRLIAARLGIPEQAPIRPGGPTLKAAIDQIYSDGRSRTIHGTNSKLGHDWSGTEGLSEQFARLCLLACFDWAAKNPLCDDPKQLSI